MPSSTRFTLFGTSNGYVVRRDDAGVWSIVYETPDHSGNYRVRDLVASVVNRSVVAALINNPFTSPAGLIYPAYTLDGGITWTDAPSDNLTAITDTAFWSPDETSDGLYTLWQDTGIDSIKIRTSADHGVSWSLVHEEPQPSGSVGYCWVENGYIWYANVGSTLLLRTSLDGSTTTSFDFSMFLDNNMGFGRGNRFDAILGVFNHYVIDISNPSSPSLSQWTVPVTGSETMRIVQMVTPTTWVGVSSSGLNGSFWQTTDAGTTWTRIVALTSHIRIPNNVEMDVDGDVLWYGASFPHTWYSTDQGASWTEEDYSGPSLGSPTWTCVAIASPAASAARERVHISWIGV